MATLRSLFARLDASLRARILIPTSILFGLTLTAMVVGAVQSYGAGMERSRQERSEIFAHMVATGVSNVMLSGQPQAVPRLLESLLAHRSDLVSASLIAPGGQVSISSDRNYVGARPWGRPDRFADTTVVTEPGGIPDQYAVIQPIVSLPSCARCHEGGAPMRGWLELRFSRDPVVEAKQELAGTLALSAGAALVALLGILIWLLGREAIGPLHRLVAAMRRAEAGELAVVADEGRTDELGVASRSFDATLAALRRSQAELEAFYQERMVRADRFAAVGEVATGLAHEIKNPLAGLSGALELLAEDLATNPHHADVVGEMRHQVRRLTNTMESLLSFARPPKAELRATDINATLEKVLFLIRQQSRNTPGGGGGQAGGGAAPGAGRSLAAGAGLPQHLPQRRPGHGRAARHAPDRLEAGGRRPGLRGGGRLAGRASRPTCASSSSSRSSPPSGRATGWGWPSRRGSLRNMAATSAIGARRKAVPSSP